MPQKLPRRCTTAIDSASRKRAENSRIDENNSRMRYRSAMSFEQYQTTADALDCFGNVAYRMTLLFDGTIRVTLPSGRTVEVEPASGTVLTPGAHLDPMVLDQCRQFRP